MNPDDVLHDWSYDEWDDFDPNGCPDCSTTMMINDADLTPAQRKSFFRTLDAIRALPEV